MLLIHAHHSTATGVQIVQHFAHILIRDGDDHVADRLQQHGAGPQESLFKALSPRDLERDVLRVHRVFLAVGDGHGNVDHGVPGEDARL